jgi:serine/threonine-protein kinase HipA
MRHGARLDKDLEELWKRIVFNICTSNSDDHLRNHGFLLAEKGWILSPAFDINPVPLSTGLSLNISAYSNEMHLDLARQEADKFRVSQEKSEAIIDHITTAVSQWHRLAKRIRIAKNEIEMMASAFQPHW